MENSEMWIMSEDTFAHLREAALNTEKGAFVEKFRTKSSLSFNVKSSLFFQEL